MDQSGALLGVLTRMFGALSIQNVVLIDRLDLVFRPGLTVLTGETGAGKSILLDALGLALGARGETALVRRGAERAVVTAEFDVGSAHPARALLGEQGLEAEGPLLLRRTLTADGRSRAFVNDQPVGVTLLRRIGDLLVEIQGQTESRGLLDPATHRQHLDASADLGETVLRVGGLYRAWREAEARLLKARDGVAKAAADEEFLRHSLAELEALGPRSGEEAELVERRAILKNGAKLADGVQTALEELTRGDGVDDALRAARRRLEGLAARAMGRLDAVLAALDRAIAEATEATALLVQANADLDLDPRRLDEVEDRLYALRAVARKHGTSVDGLASLQGELRDKLAAIEEGGETALRLDTKTAAAREAYRAAARELGEARRAAAERLDRAVGAELAPLKLEKATFATRVEELDEGAWAAHGMDRVFFEVSTNPGVPPGPLVRVASGGELSRFMLALKVALSGGGGPSTLVFDEVDFGIGGATAAAVGERLARLGRTTQVLVVTHSPQVAARADHHWRVEKRPAKGGPVTFALELAPAARRDEIARLLAGRRVTEEARAAADSLIADPPS